MPKHDAQKKLADYIEEYTGRLTKQDRSITTFGELWTAFSAVKSGCWSKKTREDLKYLFGKHVLPYGQNTQTRLRRLHQVTEFMIRKTPTVDPGELVGP